MSECDTCPKPGNCCTGFYLSGWELRSPDLTNSPNWYEKAQEVLKGYKYPFFKPIELTSTVRRTDNEVIDKGVRVGCTLLTTEGRCGDYENRPSLCRVYEPKSDPLCALHPRAETHMQGNDEVYFIREKPGQIPVMQVAGD